MRKASSDARIISFRPQGAVFEIKQHSAESPGFFAYVDGRALRDGHGRPIPFGTPFEARHALLGV